MDREFVPPGPGTWRLETTHLNCAMTAYAAEGWLTGLTRGFKEGIERYGLMLTPKVEIFLGSMAQVFQKQLVLASPKR